MEIHERLRLARASAGYKSAADAARAFGWKEPAYRHHENGTSGFKKDRGAEYAKAFNVDVRWLLYEEGEGPPPPAHDEPEGEAMDERAWTRLRNSAERLRWARMQWASRIGVDDSVETAAKSLGMAAAEYAAFEQAGAGRSELDSAKAHEFGAKFRVSWNWLLKAAGTPFEVERPVFSPEVEEVATLLEKATPDMVQAVKTLLGKTGTGG